MREEKVGAIFRAPIMKRNTVDIFMAPDRYVLVKKNDVTVIFDSLLFSP